MSAALEMNWPLTVLSDLAQHGLHRGQQVVGRIAAHVLDARLVQAQRVAQLLGRRTDRHVDVAAGGQPVHRQGRG